MADGRFGHILGPLAESWISSYRGKGFNSKDLMPSLSRSLVAHPGRSLAGHRGGRTSSRLGQDGRRVPGNTRPRKWWPRSCGWHRCWERCAKELRRRHRRGSAPTPPPLSSWPMPLVCSSRYAPPCNLLATAYTIHPAWIERIARSEAPGSTEPLMYGDPGNIPEKVRELARTTLRPRTSSRARYTLVMPPSPSTSRSV